MDGPGGQQQLRDLGCLLGAVAGEASGRLNVIWDNAPAHRGEALREYLQTPELGLNLGEFKAAIWGWTTCAWGEAYGSSRELPELANRQVR